MKLTKKLEAEILSLYHNCWDANLRGDIKAFASYLDDDVTLFGTAEGEAFTSKKAAFKFYKATADQMTGKAEFRKRRSSLKTAGNSVVMKEQCDLYVLTEEKWMFYGHVRITAVFEQKEKSWKIVQWHASFPDSKTEEGAQINIDKIKSENVQLRDAVRRRTEELENKNRELEIETALEKVRAVAMGMKKAEDMLDICRIIAKELQQLGIKQIRNIQTAIINESKATYLNYEYFRLERKKIITTLEYKKHKDIAALVKKMISDPDGHFTKTFRGSELKSWIRYQGKTGQYIDPQTKKTRSLHYYFYSIGPGALGISAYAPLTKDEISLFKKFRNVFQLAYRRFVDIEKANAQVREAQIEASLEKIRAQAMGMHKPEHLLNICQVLFKELSALGFDSLRNAMINIHNDKDKSFINYDYSDEIGRSTNHLFYNIHPLVEKQIKKIRSANDAFSETYFTGKDLVTWKKFRKKVGEKDDPRLDKNKGLYYYFYSTGIGSIGISTFGPVSEEKKTLLKRFRNVFALCYQRYIDIAKAEAQAREVQIELGLERVRARAMAMQNSDELAELVSVVFKELTHLGFSLTSCIIWISDKKTLANTLWVTSAAMNKAAEPVRLKPFHHSFFHSIIHAWKEKDSKWIYTLAGKEKASFEKSFFANEPNMPVALKKALAAPKQVVFSASFNNFGALEILGTEPLTDEKFEILHRFGKVFDSSYTRFNDLKKAEAQTREAQIEVAVERVRAKALAMHRSGEIGSVANVLRNELESLNIPGIVAATIILQQDNGKIRLWDITSVVELKEGFHFAMDFLFDLKGTKPTDWIRRIWDNKEKFFVYKQDKKKFKRTLAWTAKYDPAFVENAEVFLKTNNIKTTWHPVVPLSHGKLSLDLFQEPVAEVESILTKMAAAFDLAYKRFLDLKKAEAQTREAQIEVAVERVRAKALAMHKSAEIMGVAVTMRKELESLNMPGFDAATITLRQDDDSIRLWDNTSAKQHEDGTWENTEFIFRLEENHPDFYLNKIWNSNEKYLVVEQDENDLKITTDWVRNHDKNLADVVIHYYKEKGIKKAWHPAVRLTHGRLNLDFYAHAPEPEIEIILLKMGAAFDLAYKRFLDLKKAEAQTREAQIEVAVERVRAKALAMHKSEDLHSAVVTLKKELMGLQIPDITAATILLKQDDGLIRVLDLSDTAEEDDNKPQLKLDKTFRLEDTDPRLWIRRMWNRKENYFVIEADEEDFVRVVKWIKTFDPAGAEMAKKIIKEKRIKKAWLPTVKLEKGVMNIDLLAPPTPEIENILVKMGAGFDLAYKRFLDLQKAEAQAREAQIEAALEKVRSRSLAMHKSDELQEVITNLFDRLSELNIEAATASILIPNDDYSITQTWIQNAQRTYSAPVNIPYYKQSIISRDFGNALINKEDLLSKRYSQKEKNDWFTLLFKDTELGKIPGERRKYVLDGEAYCVSFAHTSHGGIYLGRYMNKPFTDEENNILKRFANVFEQAYVRFLDLQKAEAQAREANIEAALERVRSRSMAMHKSEELKEVIRLVLDQFIHLKINAEHAGFYIDYKAHDDMHIWLADPNIEPFFAIIPYFDTPTWNSFLDAKAKGIVFHTDLLGFKEKNKFYKSLFKLFTVPKEAQKFYLECKGLAVSTVLLDSVGLYIENFSAIPYTDEENAVLIRFGKVFQQTYTRFLDLQKAEAQAREAQIEASLERVRSRTMAMHRSEEIADIVGKIFGELSQLDLVLNRVLIWIFNDKEKYISWWSANPETESNAESYRVDYNKHPVFLSYLHAWQKRTPLHLYTLSGEIKKTWEDHLFTNTGLSKLPMAVRKGMRAEGTIFTTSTVSDYGLMMVGSFEPLSDTNIDIIQRFGRVFQQSYTRYLDVQKAEAQARESQIELGLERVRARAMAMQKSDELSELVDTVFKELTKLDFALNWCIINIIDENTMSNTVWAANPDINKTPESYHMLFEDYPFHHAMFKGWKERKTKDVYVIEGKEKEEYDEYLFNETEFRRVPEAAQAASRAMEKYVVSFTFSNFGGLQTVGDVPLSDANLDILSRFGKVFDLTYTRFNDLKNAEAQARESQIQLALERVRARTMAMHHSDELTDVVKMLYQEFDKLKISNESTDIEIGLIDEETGNAKVWAHLYLSDGSISTFNFPFALFDSINHEFEKWRSTPREKRNELFITTEFSDDLWEKFKGLAKEVPELAEMFESLIAGNIKKWVTHNAYFSHGLLTLQGTEHYSFETQGILKRFAKVFEQTYTRFLDLQKAEAQAREAQIEAALEKVRSRSLAMHKSDEIEEVLHTVFEKLKELGIDFYTAIIILFTKDSKDIVWWLESKAKRLYPKMLVPYADIEYMRNLFEAKEKGIELFSKCYLNEEKTELFHHLFEHTGFANVPEEQKKFLWESDFATISVALANNTAIHITSYSRKTISNQDNDVLKRFAKVFEQAYTRFLDLQKAEAQAREAQIEAALERVRSRSLAMHSSGELGDVVTVVLNNLMELGYIIEQGSAAHLVIFSEGTKDFVQWSADPALPHPVKSFIPYTDLPILTEFWDARQKGHDFFARVYSFDEKNTWFNFAFEHSDLKHIPGELKKLLLESETYAHSIAIEKNSAIIINSITGNQLSENQIDILRRFSKVFEQAYVRFLDLQKAEAQAREAQVELSLERIRAKVTAMQESSDLLDIVVAMRHEFVALGHEAHYFWYMRWLPEKYEKAMTSGDGTRIGMIMELPRHMHGDIKLLADWEKTDEPAVVYTMDVEAAIDYVNKMVQLGDFKQVDPHAPTHDDIRHINGLTFVMARTTHGEIGYSLPGVVQDPPIDDINTLVRFAGVFDLAYRRFEDLKEAERRNRETQIELALERVRAKVMAMSTSKDLNETSLVFGEQLRNLGIDWQFSYFWLVDEPADKNTFWITWPDYKTSYTAYTMKEAEEYFNECLIAWRAGIKVHDNVFTGEAVQPWLDTFQRIADEAGGAALEVMQASNFPYGIYYYDAMMKYGSFGVLYNRQATDEEKNIQARFAVEFERAYTRFLDLQKAEAQSREAQIELGLERVRARAMAMQNSDELKELIGTVFTELTRLDLVLTRCVIMIYDGEAKSSKWWMANSEDPDNPVGFYIKPHDYPPMNAYFKAWHERKLKFTYELKGQIKKDWDEFLFTETELKHMPDHVKEGMKAPDLVYLNASFNNFGNLTLASLEPLSEEHFDILLRFAKVFDLTYTRFNDLQKAEAQARESQIELSLERVRAKTMAMHNSTDVGDTAAAMVEELQKLGIETIRCGIGIMHEPGTMEVWTIKTNENGKADIIIGWLDMKMHPLLNGAFESWRNNTKVFSYDLEGDDLLNYYNAINNYPGYPIRYDTAGLPDLIHHNEFHFTEGTLFAFSLQQITDEQRKIFNRFAGVFGQTYRRYLDLQKAEAQAREAQIELGLERVRARAMAMQNSDELGELVAILFEELTKLDLILARCIIWIFENDSLAARMWMANSEDKKTAKSYFIKPLNHPYYNAILSGWKERKPKWLYDLKGNDKKTIDTLLLNETELSQLPDVVKQGILSSEETFVAGSFNNFGLIEASGPAMPTDEQLDILNRFGKVFDLSYTRFNDLKQAEAQAREAQIELGLERVRARAMAMQKSDELKDLIGTVSAELGKLDIVLDRCFIITYDTETMGSTWWMSNPETPTEQIGLFIKYHEHPSYLAHINAWKERKVKWEYILEGELKKTWDKFLFVETELSQLPSFVIENMRSKEKVYLSSSFNNFGYLTLATLEPLSNEQFDILLRFAKVFDLTYTRFNDLQKAEAQAREAQIEAALEKVRSRTMAMQSSNELQETAAVLFKEFKKLGTGSIYQVTIGIYKEDEQLIDFRVTSWAGGGDQENRSFQLDMSEPIVLHPSVQAWKSGKKSMVFDLTGEKLEGWIRFRNKMSGVNVSSKDTDGRRVISVAYFSKGHISISTPLPVPEETIKTLERFATVFDGTYTRFLDLQNAEAQAREAKIEASLERVRSKAMAMHSSQDLADTIGVFYNELHSFSITPRRCGVGLLDREERVGELFTWNTTEDGHSLELVGKLKMVGHPVLNGVYEHWLSQTEYNPVLRGNEIKEYYKVIRPQINFPDYHNDEVQYGYFFFFKEGGVYAWTQIEMKEDELNIYRRFTSVLSLTYKRFKDLQRAESNAREAQVEAALERVRARALAMQQPEELKEVAQVLRNEMGALGVEELETCSIYIHEKDSETAECWYALKDTKETEKKMIADHFQLDLNDTWVGREMKKFYTSDEKQTSVVMQGDNRKEWINYCYKQSPVFSGFYGETIPDRSYHLYKFSHGYIGAAAPGEISAESWKLLSRAASVFSLAYSRFKDLTQARNDLINLKEEKKRAEDALTELQATQKQLVQSEKMASLGELTAGIAHEIQNPLNFVNNFSDVSNELIDEMMEEVAKGNYEIAKEIAEDVKQNLQKINHHGKRADGIVKGMLQHSRTSSGQKESTDINALADEYLRLAYHGLRAKDKSFNAKFETEFDETVGKIEVMPQDIGRVILNLINNAFYAVSEKKKQSSNEYEPTVIVSTKRVDDKVEVKVKDNGTGIPQKVVEKIFQPFFTTKPTGQGTGLGLSLAYDIVKSHGGELKVETIEGNGTTFIIQIPANQQH